MASIAVTNTSSTDQLFLSDFYTQLEPSETKTFTRPLSDLPSLSRLLELRQEGLVTFTVTKTADELQDGIANPLGEQPLMDEGHIAFATVRLNVQPTEGDTLVIGDDTYEFVDAAGAGIVLGGIEVLTGATAAAALLNVVEAINTLSTELVWASVYNTDFLAIRPTQVLHTEELVSGPGPDIALSETLTDTATWSQVNLNLMGSAPGTAKRAVLKLKVDAVNLAADFDVLVPFTPLSATVVAVTNAAGAVDGTGKSAVLTPVAARKAVTVDLNGGTTDPVATDIVYIEVLGIA